jgi:hypothetical protein
MLGWHHSNANRYYHGCEIQTSRPHSKGCKTTVGKAFISRCDQLLRLLLFHRPRHAFFFFLWSTVQNLPIYIYIYIYMRDRGQPKYSEKNLCQCHFVHQKSQMDWPTHKPGLQQIVTGDFCYTMARKTSVKWPANKPVTFRGKNPTNRIIQVVCC